MWDCKMVKLGCMMEMLESSLDLLVNMMDMLESWESSWDSLHHEQVMVCMETWQVILVTQAEVTMLGRSLDSYHWRHCLHWD